MPASNFGGDYSRFLNMPASADDPFPNPINDAQRMQNARARAARAGTDIGSGYLNPQSGELQDPDRGFMRVIGNHPELGMLLAIGGPLAAQAALGGLGAAGATSSVIPGTGIPIESGTAGLAGAGLTAPTAAGVGAGAGAASAAGSGATASVVDRIKKSLTDPSTYAALAPLIASLAMGGGFGSGSGGSGNDELRRIQGITEARMRRVDPLHQVATQLAYQRAPIAAKQGINLANIQLPE